MPCRATLFAWAALLALAAAAPAQTYAIKIKYDPDAGKSVEVRDISRSNGGLKLLDDDGNLLHAEDPSVKELLYTETVLVKGDKQPEKYKRVYEKATEAKGDEKAKPLSHNGRTLLYESTKGQYRVGVVGKPALESKDYERLLDKANEADHERIIIRQLSHSKPVKVGDSWKLDAKELAEADKDVIIDAAKSSAEAKLVKVYTKDKAQWATFEVRLKLALAKAYDILVFDPPIMTESTITIDACIDGSTTAMKLTGTSKSKGSGKYYQGKEAKGAVEVDALDDGSTERSAEKADPKGTEAPAADFPGDKLTWEKFAPKEQKFSGEFPGKPSVDTKKDKDGNTTTTVAVTMEKGTVSYSISVTDFSTDLTGTDPKSVLDGALKAMGKTVKSSKEIQMNGFPGLEIVHESEVGKTPTHMLHRIYLVNNRMYQLLAFVPRDKKDTLEADKFFKSFRFDEKKDQ